VQNGLSWIDNKAPDLNALSKEIWTMRKWASRREVGGGSGRLFGEGSFSVQKGGRPHAYASSLPSVPGSRSSAFSVSTTAWPVVVPEDDFTKEEVVPGPGPRVRA